MLPFVPYPKIVDRVAAWGGDEAAVRLREKHRWVATEKLHGANLCIRVAASGVRVGKRRGWLADNDDFFDYRSAVGALLPELQYLRRSCLSSRTAEHEAIRVYGELVGGAYPHPEVFEVPGVHAVQTGVHYCPDIRFVAFDVALEMPTELVFLPFNDAEAALRDAGVPVVPRLGVGRFSDLLALPVEFATHLPNVFGLPPLEENFAEGLVIRPWKRAADAPIAHRMMLKRKTPRFSESGFHEAIAWALPKEPDALDQAEQIGLGLLTDARWANAMSKVGPATDKNREPIVVELMADLRATLEADHGRLILSIPEDDRALLWASLEDQARAMTTAQLRALRDPVLDPARYRTKLALAFIRGRRPRDAATLTDPDALVRLGRKQELSLHKFKIKTGPPRVTRVLSELRGIDPRSLLDIGPGRGAFLWPLLDAFPELPVTAVDTLAHRVRDIAAVQAGGIARVTALEGDVAALPFEDDAFDVVTVLEVLEHLEDPAPAAREVLRVAARTVVASVPSQEDDNPEHLRLFTHASLEALFIDAGASRVRIDHVRGHRVAVIQ
ncbi:MAG: RNA ligase family protein [Myxococcota bacterium]